MLRDPVGEEGSPGLTCLVPAPCSSTLAGCSLRH